jgi:EAL domain-containing protein (putative c-di-GMP-specific phosphodiesterase class I)
MQGFLFSKPVPPKVLTAMLRRGDALAVEAASA